MDPVRKHLLRLLEGGQAFDTYDSIVAEFAVEHRFVTPPGADHNAWEILEHLRIALRDILDYCQNEDGHYRELDWPREYWPEQSRPGDEAWDATITAYVADLKRLNALIADPERDILAPFAWGTGQTLFREATLVAEHAAYHLGQLVELRRWIGD